MLRKGSPVAQPKGQSALYPRLERRPDWGATEKALPGSLPSLALRGLALEGLGHCAWRLPHGWSNRGVLATQHVSSGSVQVARSTRLNHTIHTLLYSTLLYSTMLYEALLCSAIKTDSCPSASGLSQKGTQQLQARTDPVGGREPTSRSEQILKSGLMVKSPNPQAQGRPRFSAEPPPRF